MSADHADMLRWVLHVHGLQKIEAGHQPGTAEKWRAGRRVWRDYYAGEMLADAQRSWRSDRAIWPLARAFWRAGRLAPLATVSSAHNLLRRRWRQLKQRPPRFGKVNFGDFGGVTPIDADFGFNRGTPVDRYYVERFLQRHAADIRGRVLEIGDSAYSQRFGGHQITRQDVLHVAADAPQATITGDLSQPGLLPRDAFDCMVLTQTLHLIFDLRAAIAEMYSALKPGGVLLVTVPGISKIDPGEWGNSWYWSLTHHSARRLFAEVFGQDNVAVSAFGNVYAATAFLQGLALEEVKHNKLDIEDASYPLIVTVRAQRELTT
jgi:SAM-dependent methyltransferase